MVRLGQCFFFSSMEFFEYPGTMFFLQGTPSGNQMWQVKLPVTRWDFVGRLSK
jgi:hypothetical protein